MLTLLRRGRQPVIFAALLLFSTRIRKRKTKKSHPELLSLAS